MFIKEGINVINNFDKFEKKNIYDFLKIKYYIYILNEINEDIYIKRFISKDATASVYQHFIKILDKNSLDSLKWCNLNNNDKWYGTYSFIINDFKKI